MQDKSIIKTDVQPITWHFSPQHITCHCCAREPATHRVEVESSSGYFTGTFSVCNSCSLLDGQSIYDGIAGK